MKFLIVGLIIISLVLVLIVVTNYQKYQKTIKDINFANRELEKDYESLIDELSQMKKIAESSTTGNYELTRQMADLKNINGALERELSIYKENEVAHQNILKAISDAENELKFRQDLLRENEAALKQLDDRYSEQLGRLENAHAEEKVLKTAIEEFHTQQSQMQMKILKLNGEIEEVEGLLAELKETHRLAVEKALGDEGKNGQG
jgi:chromosome segregation ATPase